MFVDTDSCDWGIGASLSNLVKMEEDPLTLWINNTETSNFEV